MPLRIKAVDTTAIGPVANDIISPHVRASLADRDLEADLPNRLQVI